MGNILNDVFSIDLIEHPKRAMAKLWQDLRNEPSFKRLENDALSMSPEERDEKVQTLVELLIEGEPLKIRNQKIDNPLLWLGALDQYLYECLGSNEPWALGPTTLQGTSESFWIHRRVVPYSNEISHAAKTGRRQSWLKHHWILPSQICGLKIRISSAASFLRYKCQEAVEDEELGIFVGNFPDGEEPSWIELDPPGWRAAGLSDQEKRWRGILSVLSEASRLGAKILVLPELAVCPELRERISIWLDDHEDHSFLMVLPGSFHEKIGEAVFNHSKLLDSLGHPVLTHNKLTTFGEKTKPERISTGNCIELLDTPLGLVGIPICLDFCEEGSPFNHLWDEIGAEWLLVPAMGGQKSLNAHARRAAALYRAHGTISVVANQSLCGADQDHGFVHHAGCSNPPTPADQSNRFIKINLTSAPD